MRLFLAAAAAALISAPAASASPLSSDEVDFLNDIEAIGITTTTSDARTVDNGWAICGVLNRGYSRDWVAEQIYTGSQSTNGSAGLPYAAAQALVFYANADLCPGVGEVA